MSLPELKISLDTSENNLREELYVPCLKWADRFDRGVGFFTSGWLSYNLSGMSDFAARGGKMRLITSPILSNKDSDAIIGANSSDVAAFEKFEAALLQNVDVLQKEMKKDILNAFSWMLYDGIIEMKFAIPCNKLDDGDFHAKFGIFCAGEDSVAYSGSINDSIHGYSNFESITVFKSWTGTKEYVDNEKARFERIWNCRDKNLKIYTIPSAVKSKIFTLRTSGRPYTPPKAQYNKWEHQDRAVDCFLEKEHGILAMATGTGKTVTAIKIMQRLFESGSIKRVVITMAGNDLLDQWAKQIRAKFTDKPVYTQYGTSKEMGKFLLHPDNAFLLLSSDANNLSKLLDLLEKHPGDYHNDTLFVFDEVHGAGSASRVDNLAGKIAPYKYRLGLSATPEREYDEEGNGFIETEIGPIIYQFGLEDAIRKGILCPFDYVPLTYELTDEEKKKKRSIIASYNAKRKNGEPVSENDLYTQLALVNKTASLKLVEFRNLISNDPSLLDKCIIFVQTREYGEKVQEILLKSTDRYHTYYAEDEKKNLEDFAAGKLECLLTCKKVSEGIDISRVANIILFSSDRSKLVTTQRIGRALRLDPQCPDKKATVVDFILESDGTETDENADTQRAEWLSELAKVRRDLGA